MAEPTNEQRARIRNATQRMTAMGIHDDGYPDARRNGDIFFAFRIEDLFPLIALAEAGNHIDALDRFLINTGQIKPGDSITVK